MYSLTPFTFFCHNLLFPIYKAGFSLTFCLSSFFLLVFEPSYPQQSCLPSVSLHLLSGCITFRSLSSFPASSFPHDTLSAPFRRVSSLVQSRALCKWLLLMYPVFHLLGRGACRCRSVSTSPVITERTIVDPHSVCHLSLTIPSFLTSFRPSSCNARREGDERIHTPTHTDAHTLHTCI